jgi:tetratricopeptide (TPR) repeat protein
MGLSQAEEVCAPGLAIDVLDGVTALIDQSLLRPIPDAVADTRFFMLETIREFAAERLHNSPEAGEIAERHAHSYLALAETAGPEFTKPNQRHWLDRAEADIDNLRAALTMAVDAGRGAIAQRMAGSLWRFWQMRGYLNEGRSRAEAALATPGGDDRSLLQAHDAAAGLAYWQGDMPAALDHYRESLQLARRIGDPAVIAMSLYNFSIPTGLLIGRKEAFEALDEGLALAEQVGDRKLIGLLWWGLGNAYFVFGFGDTELSPGDAESALARYARAAEFLDGTDAIYHIGWNERMLGNVLLHLKRPEEALPHLQKSLDIFVDAGDLSALPLHVADFSTLAVLKGDYERALILAGATHALQAVSETRLLEIIQDLGEMNNAIAAVGAEQAEKLLRDGQNLSVDQVLEMIRGS